MAKKHTAMPQKLQPWLAARTKYRLTHAQIQMARELGMNPKKFGGLANHRQEPWKVPLPQFIEDRYRKRFGKSQPADMRSIEERVAAQAARKVAAQRPEGPTARSRDKPTRRGETMRCSSDMEALLLTRWRL